FLLLPWNFVVAAPAGISQNARAEIDALLQEKASWTPTQRKLESQLIHALKKNRGQPFAARASRLRMDLAVRADGRVLVDITANVTPELLALIQRGGGQVINSFSRYRAIRAIVPVGQLETLSRRDDVA